ncbi:MAG: hypothetical protein K5678_05195 [Acetatifactor sp.]|nr:hypothetical protein [Acetatifactor sp.]
MKKRNLILASITGVSLSVLVACGNTTTINENTSVVESSIETTVEAAGNTTVVLEESKAEASSVESSSVSEGEQQQVPDSNGEGSSIVEGDGSAAEGSWDEDPVDTTGDDQQSGEAQQPEVQQPGALTDYTQCAYYKTSKGKDDIEFKLRCFIADDSIPSQFVKKAFNTAEAQQAYKDLLTKNNCKNADEASDFFNQVVNSYYDMAGYQAWVRGSSQQTPQQQQAVQQAQDSGLLQPIGGGDSSSQGGDGGFTGEDPAAGTGSMFDDWHDTGIGECAVQ